MKKIILIGLCVGFSFYAKGSDLTALDSVGIEKVGDKMFIIHSVEPKETLFGISRRYETSVNDIIQANQELKQGLKIGQRIQIPFIPKAAIPDGAKLHKVAPGETLFSISKAYNVSIGEIMEWNNLKGNDLSVGQSLVLEGVAEPKKAESTVVVIPPSTPENVKAATPAAKKLAEPAYSPEVPKSKTSEPVRNTSGSENIAVSAALVPGEWITHTVIAGETLFSIAQKYDAKIENIINWNALTSNNLSLGQQLKVGREAAAPSKVPVVSSNVPVIVNNERKEAVLTTSESEDETTEYKNVKETGLAEVIEGTGNHKKYLVLHKDAPVGTIMRVRNEENDITIFARVVGKLPQTGDNQRLVIKLSKAAFDQLRAVNPRFPVEVSY